MHISHFKQPFPFPSPRSGNSDRGKIGGGGICSIAGNLALQWENEYWEDTHGVWLDGGVKSTSPLPHGRIRWDLQVPEAHAPSTTSQSSSTFDSAGSEEGKGRSEGGDEWESKIAAGAYDRDDSIEVLRNMQGSFIPYWNFW
jgi:hypothetical protein